MYFKALHTILPYYLKKKRPGTDISPFSHPASLSSGNNASLIGLNMGMTVWDFSSLEQNKESWPPTSTISRTPMGQKCKVLIKSAMWCCPFTKTFWDKPLFSDSPLTLSLYHKAQSYPQSNRLTFANHSVTRTLRKLCSPFPTSNLMALTGLAVASLKARGILRALWCVL